MFDLQTLVIVNTMIFVTMSLLMIVSRWTLGDASAGAMSWVVGDVLFEGARLVAMVHADLVVLPAGMQTVVKEAPQATAVGFCVVGAFWWHARALRRVEGDRTSLLRLGAESMCLALGWVVFSLALPDDLLRDRLLLVAMVLGASVSLPPVWRLARRFWGARVLLLALAVPIIGQSMRLVTQWSELQPGTAAELGGLLLAEIVIAVTSTMGVIMMLQEQVRQRLVEISVSDPLTGLYNRRGLLALLQRDFERARRAHQPLSMVLFDLDHFKRINDRHGHEAGDAVLQGFAERLRATYRQGDLIGRWGGEEFVVVMPGIDALQAARGAERLRELLLRQPPATGLPSVTVSGGVAEMDLSLDPQHAIRSVIAAADRRMYAAKLRRDCICTEDDQVTMV